MSSKIEKITPDNIITKELGRRLAKIRKSQGFSHAKLAKEAGLGVATLKRIELGHDGQMETWIKLLKALNRVGSLNLLLPEQLESPRQKVLKTRKSTRIRAKTPSSSGQKWGDEE